MILDYCRLLLLQRLVFKYVNDHEILIFISESSTMFHSQVVEVARQHFGCPYINGLYIYGRCVCI